jgi:hypothetical protein
MGIPDPITGPKGVRMILFIRGVTGWVLTYSHGLELVNDISASQVFWLIRHVLVTPVLVCRRCDNPSFFNTSYNSSGWNCVFEGELLHQASCRRR